MVYKVPFVNYPKHYRRMWNEVINAISEALSRGDLLLRGQLRQFEKDIASFIGAKYACAALLSLSFPRNCGTIRVGEDGEQ